VEVLAVYLDLLKDYYDREGKPEKVIARQKCGQAPYELAMRFAGCNLSCGLCFASGYSWPNLFLKGKSVSDKKTVEDAVSDFKAIPMPKTRECYNWLRVLGGEPLLSDEYVDFLFRVLLRISSIDSKKFNNGIIIQTNGIHVGKGNTALIRDCLQELYRQNPSVVVVFETSIKGTNPDEFKLLTRTESDELSSYNLRSYYNLKDLGLPNLRSMIVAGFGVNESFLLRQGESKERMTIVSRDSRPCFHPELWSEDFKRLYEDFTGQYQHLDPMFSRMPMYGIKDRFDLGWVKRSLKQSKEIYGDKFYDSKYASVKDMALENSFNDILEKFFLVDNQTYYSAMIRRRAHDSGF
jgi:uncharacterized Fe-S cluster-containing radical SAM superfamily protein